jgi:hypothetical protein
MIMKRTDLEAFHPPYNDTLAQYFDNRPTLNSSSLDPYIQRHPHLKHKLAVVQAAWKRNNVKPAATPAYWDQPHL